MKTGAELIAEERKRQITKEGFDENHDHYHAKGDLAMAAACYACNAGTMVRHATPELMDDYAKNSSQGYRWPWAEKWWKPKDPVRDLVRAGALIAAEIDRLNRQKK